MNQKYDRPLTTEELAATPDEDIDYSDIPELGEDFWKDAKLVEPMKKSPVYMMLDQDIIDFFKQRRKGKRGYQTDINSVLRTFVEAHRDSPQ
jgi:uncharacterized protein (DUF4415 family)